MDGMPGLASDLSPEALALAEQAAAQDRALLERLVREGRVVRVGGPEVARRRAVRVNLAIIPKAKRRRRKR